jgi:hypothetical protein
MAHWWLALVAPVDARAVSEACGHATRVADANRFCHWRVTRASDLWCVEAERVVGIGCR